MLPKKLDGLTQHTEASTTMMSTISIVFDAQNTKGCWLFRVTDTAFRKKGAKECPALNISNAPFAIMVLCVFMPKHNAQKA